MLIKAILTIGGLWLFGWIILRIIFSYRYNLNKLEVFSLCFGLGVFAISIITLILSWINIPLSKMNIILSVVLFLSLIFFISKLIKATVSKKALINTTNKLIELDSKTAKFHLEKYKIIEYVILFLIFYVACISSWNAINLPFFIEDSWANWGFKAKIFYLHKGIPDIYFNKLLDFRQQLKLTYPPLIPFAEAIIYIFQGGIREEFVKLIFPIFYFSILLLFYSMLRRFTTRLVSLLFTLILATTPKFFIYSTIGMADLPLVFYFTAACFYLFLWMNYHKFAFIILSAIFSSACIWTKQEALPLFLILFITGTIFIFNSYHKRKYLYHLLTYVLIVSGITLMWFGFLKIHGLSLYNPKYFPSLNITWVLSRFGPFFVAFLKEMINIKMWNIVWVGIVFIFIFQYTQLKKYNLIYLVFIFFMVFLYYILIHAVSPFGVNWLILFSSPRRLLYILPGSLFICAILFDSFISLE